MDPDNTSALSIRRWLLLSGWLGISVGLAHNVVGSLIIARPTSVTAVVARLGLPMSLLTPIVPPEQNDLVLMLSLTAGIALVLFGAILIWQGRARAAHPDIPLLAVVFVWQLSVFLLMLLLAPLRFPIVWIVGFAAGALGTAVAKALRSSR